MFNPIDKYPFPMDCWMGGGVCVRTYILTHVRIHTCTYVYTDMRAYVYKHHVHTCMHAYTNYYMWYICGIDSTIEMCLHQERLRNARCRFFSFLAVMRCVVDKDSTIPIHMCAHQERFCVTACTHENVDGTYMSCEDCREYFVCKGDSGTKHKCPATPNWGFNVDTRQCQYKSPHCFPCTGWLHLLLLHIWIKL